MPPKTVKRALTDMLEDLTGIQLEKFCSALVDRRGESQVRRGALEGKTFVGIADVLVSIFTQSGALEVALEILGEIGCNEERESLGE